MASSSTPISPPAGPWQPAGLPRPSVSQPPSASTGSSARHRFLRGLLREEKDKQFARLAEAQKIIEADFSEGNVMYFEEILGRLKDVHKELQWLRDLQTESVAISAETRTRIVREYTPRQHERTMSPPPSAARIRACSIEPVAPTSPPAPMVRILPVRKKRRRTLGSKNKRSRPPPRAGISKRTGRMQRAPTVSKGL